VLVCGGLGPTADDRTREALAVALGRGLARDAAGEQAIRARIESVGRTPSAAQLRQADFPEGARMLANPVGVAPGFVVEEGGGWIVALPGVPGELKAIFDASLAPLVRARHGTGRARRVLKIAGRTESYVNERVAELLGPDSVTWTILATEGGVQLVLRAAADSDEAARAALAALEAGIRERLGSDVYGADGETLPAVVGALLAASGRTVACAESCTAGLLAATLTEVPGSSAWFRGEIVAYADDLKSALAGVDRDLMTRHGAVSEQVAGALAAGAARVARADYGVGITGIAGPGGGTPAKPVGLVHVAVAPPAGQARARTLRTLGDRETIRRRSVTAALDELRRSLLGVA
jgi:nicotinamide-nucleotide amidase